VAIRYAVKILSQVINSQRYLRGIIDMAIETRFLSDVSIEYHQNARHCQIDAFSEECFIGMDRHMIH
jgi:hypothetical protein